MFSFSAESNLALAMAIPLASSFLATVGVTSALIPFLRKIGNLQPIFDEAPEEHRRKQGTPTMGGVAILCGVVAGCAAIFLVCGFSANLLAALVVMLIFGAIGFLDDYTKITKKRNMGLRARQKIALQILVGLAFACYYVFAADMGTWIVVPFFWEAVNIGWWIFPYIVFVVVAMVNAVNLTDGLDGLASSVSAVPALFWPALASLAYALGLVHNGELALENVRMDLEDALFFSALAGACLGFLAFNRYPARIFMGDTGSLAIGGGLSAAAIVTHTELLLPVCGFIFVVEALSDIIQVSSYKLRAGRRVFKMAPLHHHFELSGWHEKKVVTVFSSTTLVLCVCAMALMISQSA
jgi:phospho-N-acetylmuramoyl-pentapeptide-transferase